MKASDKTYSVAVLDDDEVYRQYASILLSKHSNFVVHEAASGDDLKGLLDQHTIDCVVLDLNLELESGFSVKERLSRNTDSFPAIVVLTGDGSERAVIKALRLGVDDYVPKRNLQPGELVAAIARAVERSRHGQVAKGDHQRLTQAAGFDTVTRLFGRAHLDISLAQIAALPPRSREAYGLILVELPELPAINENFGLAVGAQALRSFAERLRAICRSGDVCGRYADGTFLCIVETKGHTDLLVETCRRLASELRFQVDLDAATLNLSAAVGGVPCEGTVGPACEALLDVARRALEEARTSATSYCVLTLAGDEVEDRAAAPESATSDSVAPNGLRSSDRRKEPRHRVVKRGQIIFLGLGSVVDCTVRNISERGAGLRITTSFAVPEEFDLVVVGMGSKRRVRVRWQNGKDIGVEYQPG